MKHLFGYLIILLFVFTTIVGTVSFIEMLVDIYKNRKIYQNSYYRKKK